MKNKLPDVDKLRTELYKQDPPWHIQLALVGTLILQLTLPDNFIVGPKYVMVGLEALLLLSLLTYSKQFALTKALFRRVNSLTFISLIALANIYALQQLSHLLLLGGHISDGHSLIRTAFNIFLTNIIVFSLLYWEIDGGGPLKRSLENMRDRDFLFSQMTAKEFVPAGWMPSYVDYLFLSGTNALAFSPTDTMPLTRAAKLLMLLQALVSLTTLGLVAARAVNILS